MKKMPLFSKSHKNPAEIVKILKDNLAILEKQDKKTDKVWLKTEPLLKCVYFKATPMQKLNEELSVVGCFGFLCS